MGQLTIYDFLDKKYIINKPIRLIELFAGYGSQALALKYLGVEFTHWRICEWATKSIQAYNDLHIRDYKDYSNNLTQNEVIERLVAYGISMNYNEPMTYEQIKRKGEQWQRQTYNNIIATNNLVDISKVKSKDLNIIDTDKYEYILTYSFPCQDLSIAGKRKGMAKGKETRSGLLWQVERILEECEQLPQVLLMENVPDVIGSKNIKHFKEWYNKLESLGYTNYYKVLNAKDYCIPQHRKRCFMISILNNKVFTFPKETKLKYVLKHLLLKSGIEKYFIDNKKAKLIMDQLLCKEQRLIQVAQLEGNFESTGRVYSIHGLAPTINTCGGGQREPKILTVNIPQTVKVRKFPVDTMKLANILKQAKVKCGLSNKDIATKIKLPLTTVEHWFREDKSFAIPTAEIWEELKSILNINTNEFDTAITTFEEREGVFEKTDRHYLSYGIAPTLTAASANEKIIDIPVCLNSKVNGKQPSLNDRVYSTSAVMPAVTTTPFFMGNILQNFIIRKLSPNECFRLMGVIDQDFNNIAINQRNSSLYHLAGDSIVTTCLMAIFGELLGLDYETKINELVEVLKGA